MTHTSKSATRRWYQPAAGRFRGSPKPVLRFRDRCRRPEHDAFAAGVQRSCADSRGSPSWACSWGPSRHARRRRARPRRTRRSSSIPRSKMPWPPLRCGWFVAALGLQWRLRALGRCARAGAPGSARPRARDRGFGAGACRGESPPATTPTTPRADREGGPPPRVGAGREGACSPVRLGAGGRGPPDPHRHGRSRPFRRRHIYIFRFDRRVPCKS